MIKVATRKKKILLVPLDPVHDMGLKLIRKALADNGHATTLLPPGLKVHEVVEWIIKEAGIEFVLVSRTLGYRVGELLARFVDLVEACGLREQVTLLVGGMAVRPELAAEMGFDAGFGPGTSPEEVVAFIEGRHFTPWGKGEESSRKKRDLTSGFSYIYKNKGIERSLALITGEIIDWVSNKTSPGVERARIRFRSLREGEGDKGGGWEKYQDYCAGPIAQYYKEGRLPRETRTLSEDELRSLRQYKNWEGQSKIIRPGVVGPDIFIQYGTGCPLMDILHIKTGEAWGAAGVVHFDPSEGARSEGLLGGYLSHAQDGTLLTWENLRLIKCFLNPLTLWQVRAHRGLNTPETVVLAGEAGADLTKINMAYASLGAGMDPARITVDGVEALRWAAHYDLALDVVTNEELSGVPAHKAFAGMLIVAHLALQLGARPILQPLFCYSPEVMLQGQMRDNYIDFNAAKILALRQIIAAPLWPGAPIGFLTHTEDRVQSSVTTALHACLARSLGVQAISIASSDEAYAGGPIAAASRVDTLRAVQEGFRFFGSANIQPTPRAREWAGELIDGIARVLTDVANSGSFVQSLYRGLLGGPEDGAYPGRIGRGTLRRKEVEKDV
ncbi:MAG: cobalamin B12-binding domain-containing protein [Firmicutes bacterium]|nr:cobalamin B12-binding domain-containing protein [Bacillota bacterium]